MLLEFDKVRHLIQVSVYDFYEGNNNLGFRLGGPQIQGTKEITLLSIAIIYFAIIMFLLAYEYLKYYSEYPQP